MVVSCQTTCDGRLRHSSAVHAWYAGYVGEGTLRLAAAVCVLVSHGT